MDGTFLVLGASRDQIFMIETAQSMGLQVVAIDMNPESKGFEIADERAVVSTRALPELLKLVDELWAAGHRIRGVATMGSDIPEIVAAVAEKLGTPGPSALTARLATDKLAMKQRFQVCGIPIPWFECVERFDEFEAVLAARGLPAVLKPIDRSGSRGVFLLEDGCDLRALFERSMAFSRVGRCLLEEYLEGPQISTESLLFRGRGVTPGFADRNYDLLDEFRPQFMENGGWVPSNLCTEDQRAIDALVVRSAIALGIEDGVAKGDVVLTSDGPKMIEMAARLSGGDFCESLVPLGAGINYVEAVIRLAIGEDPELDSLVPTKSRCVANRYFFARPGRLLEIKGEAAVRAQPGVAKLDFFYAIGDEIPPTTSHAERFGVFVVVGADRVEVQERVDWVYQTLEIVVAD